MNIARSLTKRLRRAPSLEELKPQPPKMQISEPMGLISTTNQWVHQTPNVADLDVKKVQQRQISTSSAGSSTSVSDVESSPVSEPPSMTDASSVESFSPAESPSPSPIAHNHLTQYFDPSEKPPVPPKPASMTIVPSPNSLGLGIASPLEARDTIAPTLPARSMSHSKREHERLARVRSVRSSTASSEHANHSQQSSLAALEEAPAPPPKSLSRPASTVEEEPSSPSPFSNELKHIEEIAEDYKPGASNSWITDDADDRRVMSELGLKQFRASDYLREIQSFREGLWALLEEEEEDREERLAAWI